MDDWAKKLLTSRGDGMERREGQIHMATDVAQALRGQSRVMVEAGTGIGKSLAYLVPAAIWSLDTGERVVVSTTTKVLQEQLLASDAEDLRKLLSRYRSELGTALSVVAVKGRSNYLCRGALRRRIQDLEGSRDAAFLARLVVWSAQTKRGDRAELSLTSEDEERFGLVSASNGKCSGKRCHYHRWGKCFLPKVQQRARAAHIVITNHSLLVSEREGGGLLPEGVWGLIVDEAHELEDAATNVLTNEMPKSWLGSLLRRVHHKGRKRDYGIAAECVLVTKAEHDDEVSGCLCIAFQQKRLLRELVAQAEESLTTLYDRIADFAYAYPETKDQQGSTTPLTAGHRRHRDWERIVVDWESTRAIFDKIITLLDKVEDAYLLAAVSEVLEKAPRLIEASDEVCVTNSRFRDRVRALDDVLTGHNPNVVSWLELSADSDSVFVIGAPLSVREEMQKIWLAHRSVVLTSATLGTGEGEADFEFVSERLGFGFAGSRRYPSPFDYERRVRLHLPSDMPVAGRESEEKERYVDAVARAIVELSTASRGRTLVLFMSKRDMNAVSHKVRRRLKAECIELFVQDIDGLPADISESMRNKERAVGFGVASMWTGVDIPDDSLSQVIIAKLPFRWYLHPVQRARAVEYENGFSEYSLPQAVIQFRQGFGRLMRRRSDRGVVVVLDGRVNKTKYGKLFVTSVLPPGVAQPNAWIQRMTVPEAAREIGAFLDSVPISS